MTGCRIGRVKLKNGAEILRFPSASRDDVQKHLVDTAAYYATTYNPGELEGFIIVAWSKETSISLVRIEKAGMVSRSTAPHFAAEEVRRALHQQGHW